MTTLILGLSCESHSISRKISHPSTHSLFLLAWLVENYRLFLLLNTWQFEKKMKAPKGSVSILCVCLYLCVCVHKCVRVHKVHLTVFAGCSLDASCGQHSWSAVYSFYLKSDLRCDCLVKIQLKAILERTNTAIVAYRTPAFCNQLENQRCVQLVTNN